MAENTVDDNKLVNDFLIANGLAIKILPFEIRRMEDGALLIETPKVGVGKAPPPSENGELKPDKA